MPGTTGDNQAQSTTATIVIDGSEFESPKVTTPRDIKLLVKPKNQVVAFDLQEVNPQGKVKETYRAATEDDEDIRVHNNQRFQLIPNGAPFS